MTAPDPRWHPNNMTMFDVGRVQQLDHDDIQPKIAHVMGNMLQAVAGGCLSGFCKVRTLQTHTGALYAICNAQRPAIGALKTRTQRSIRQGNDR